MTPVSYAPSKIPYSGFSPVRLKEDTLLPGPAGFHRLTQRSPHSGFSTVFPIGGIRCQAGGVWLSPTPWPYSLARPHPPTGPSLQAGYSVPPLIATMTRSADLSRLQGFALQGFMPQALVRQTFPAFAAGPSVRAPPPRAGAVYKAPARL